MRHPLFKSILAVYVLVTVLFIGCQSAKQDGGFVIPFLSPAVVATVEKPWKKAEALARRVPNSIVMVAHGGSMLPLYPADTVIVVQKIKWEYLKAGMTAIYYRDPVSRFSFSGNILLRKEDERWHLQAAGENLENPALLDRSNFIGVVVAAFVHSDDYDAALLLREAPEYADGTCTLRCHASLH